MAEIEEISKQIEELQKSVDKTLANIKELRDILIPPIEVMLGPVEREMLDEMADDSILNDSKRNPC